MKSLTARTQTLLRLLKITTIEDARAFDWLSILDKKFYMFGVQGGLTFTDQGLDRIKKDLEISDFDVWLNSDNVVKDKFGYTTQCTQYRKRYNLPELKEYFTKEYLVD